MIVGTVITIAAAFPRSLKIPPIAVLRDIAQDTLPAPPRGVIISCCHHRRRVLPGPRRRLRLYFVLGLFLAVTTLAVIAGPISRFLAWPIPRIKGITGVLARENAIRNPKRTASTAAALMIAVTLIGFITVFADSAKASVDQSINQNFNGDFLIDSQTFGQGGLPVTMADELNALPEVQDAAGVRVGQAQIAFGAETVAGVDPAVIFDVVDVGDIQGDTAGLNADDTIALSADQAEEFGLGIDDTINVRFPSSTEVKEFRIVALYEREDAINVNIPIDYLFGLPAYEANFEDQYDNQVIVTLADGVNPGRPHRHRGGSDVYPLA